ncbi:MAG: hypothetical protein K0S65_4261, partial [Labilithrix sp.]|nr:hypothetical protein [Labilithrix sp.]
MMQARVAVGVCGFVVLLAACVGGPGPLPGEGTDDRRSGSRGEESTPGSGGST